MAWLWDEQIGDCTISRALKKIGFTRKKRPMATANGMKKNDRHLQGSCPQYPLRRLSILMNQGWIVCINMIMVGTRCGQRFHALKSGRRQGRVNIIAASSATKIRSLPSLLRGRVIELCWKPGWKVVCFRHWQLDRLWWWIMPHSTKVGVFENWLRLQALNYCIYPPIPQTSTCIEQCWSRLKSRIRKKLEQFDCLRDAIEDVLRQAS